MIRGCVFSRFLCNLGPMFSGKEHLFNNGAYECVFLGASYFGKTVGVVGQHARPPMVNPNEWSMPR